MDIHSKQNMKRAEADRPTNNTLKYLTTVRPHLIQRDNLLVDPYVRDAMYELTGFDPEELLGPYTRSLYSLEGHYANIWLYDRPIIDKPYDFALDRAINITREAFRLPTPATAISWNSLRDVPFITTSAAGWGYRGKKGEPFNHNLAIRRAVGVLHAWINGKTHKGIPFRLSPDLAFTRTQLGAISSPKVRHVWGEAFENILLEGLCAAPLISAYQIKGDPMPIGVHIYKRLPIIIQNTLYSNEEKRVGVGTDMKSFDSSVQPWLINTAFDILKENLQFPGLMEEQSFEFSRDTFITRPVVMPDGRMWLKQLGIPSGSYYTQLIGSIINHIITTYAQLKVYGRHFKTWVLGDDSIFGIPIEIDDNPDPTAFVRYYADLGFILHPDKTIISSHPDSFEFLGHCARGSKVSREMDKTMRLALYPEYPVTGPAVSLSRVRGLMLDSGLTSWPIIQLNDYMSAKYRSLPEFEALECPVEDRHWFASVVGKLIPPKDIDMIRAWTLT